MKYLSLMALCALQFILASAVQARSPENIDSTVDSSPGVGVIFVAANEQNQSDTSKSGKESEEEPDCE